MNTRTAYSRPEGKRVIDTDTGEELTLTPTASTWADKNFMKIFIKNFRRALKGVVNQKMQVALWILENMTPANEVRHTYKEIADGSKSSLQTVVRTVETLEKDNFLCRTMHGIMVNPDVAFRGRYESRAAVLGIYKDARRANRDGVPDEAEKLALMGQLEDKEKELNEALAHVNRIEREKREIEKRLAPRRKTGPKPKEES